MAENASGGGEGEAGEGTEVAKDPMVVVDAANMQSAEKQLVVANEHVQALMNRNLRMKEELDEQKAEGEDAYFFMQKKLDDNYEVRRWQNYGWCW